jgi:hypothetical protein
MPDTPRFWGGPKDGEVVPVLYGCVPMHFYCCDAIRRGVLHWYLNVAGTLRYQGTTT